MFVQEGAILMLSTAETATYWKCKPPSSRGDPLAGGSAHQQGDRAPGVAQAGRERP